MASLNKVQLIGHLGKAPEVRNTQEGDPVATFRMATSETWKDRQTGERRERTEWHTVVVFNKPLAEFAGKYLRKGSLVYVEGELRTRKWSDDKGVDRWTTEVVLPAFFGVVTLLDRKESAAAPPAASPDGYGTAREGFGQ